MKKVFLSVTIVVSVILMVVYFTKTSKQLDYINELTTATLNHPELDLGEIKVNQEIVKTIEIINTGNNPLIIYDIETSCGCTVPEWDKRPVKKGDSVKVKIKYKDHYPGRFIKTITVYGNIKENLTCQLKGSLVN